MSETQLIEKGQGDVWTFAASVHCTSGIPVIFDSVAGEIKPASALGADIVGVTLMPTRDTGTGTVGTNSVAIDKVVYVNTTGSAIPAGGLVQVTGVYFTAFTTPSGTNLWTVVAGRAFENIAANARGLVKLIW